MRFVRWVVVAAVLFSGCQAWGSSGTYVLPAEWEQQDAVWVSFFGANSDVAAYEIVKAIAPYTHVMCVVPGGHAAEYLVRSGLNALGVAPDRYDIVHSPGGVQVRDMGPLFTRNSEGKIRVVDFRWNDYGEKASLDGDYRHPYSFDALMAGQMNIPRFESSLAMEGGALETNGKGTLLQVESVDLQRNPGFSKERIEAELKSALGQDKIIWLKEGPAEDPHRISLITDGYVGQGTGGHVDSFARFVGPHTVLLAFPDSAEAAKDPVKAITLQRMQVNYEILQHATDHDGEPLEIIKVPVPDVEYPMVPIDTTWDNYAFHNFLHANPALHHGDLVKWVPTSSYLNFFVTNRIVLVPSYWKAGLPESVKREDERFQAVMARHFPNRKIVPIYSLPLNLKGGGIHCWTQQQPALS